MSTQPYSHAHLDTYIPLYQGERITKGDSEKLLDKLSELSGVCHIITKNRFMEDGDYTLDRTYRSGGYTLVAHGSLKELGLLIKGMIRGIQMERQL